MISISAMASFIEFVGAFNFVNVYSPFQRKVFKYFLNVNREFETAFKEKETMIVALKSSKFGVLILKDGRSNMQVAIKLQKKCDNLAKEEEEIRRRVHAKIQTEYTTKFSRSLFLFCGIYSVFSLLSIGVMDMCRDVNIASSVAVYNIVSWLVVLYFGWCEWAKHFPCLKNKKYLFPTRLTATVISLITPFAGIVNWGVLEMNGPCISMSEFTIDMVILSGVALTFMGFFLTLIAIGIYYHKAMSLIKNQTDYLEQKYVDLNKEKIEFDKTTEMFASDLTFG